MAGTHNFYDDIDDSQQIPCEWPRFRFMNNWRMCSEFYCITLFNVYWGGGLWGFVIFNLGFEFCPQGKALSIRGGRSSQGGTRGRPPQEDTEQANKSTESLTPQPTVTEKEL